MSKRIASVVHGFRARSGTTKYATGHALQPSDALRLIDDLNAALGRDLGVLHDALRFIEEEADNRAAAGSETSDYEREPRELAERLRAALAEAEGRS